MSRPPMPPGRARTNTLRVRLKPSERDLIEAAARAAGRSTTEWVRQRLLQEPSASPVASPAPESPRPLVPTGGAHRHRPDGSPVPEARRGGMVARSYRCECGYEWTRESPS